MFKSTKLLSILVIVLVVGVIVYAGYLFAPSLAGKKNVDAKPAELKNEEETTVTLSGTVVKNPSYEPAALSLSSTWGKIYLDVSTITPETVTASIDQRVVVTGRQRRGVFFSKASMEANATDPQEVDMLFVTELKPL